MRIEKSYSHTDYLRDKKSLESENVESQIVILKWWTTRFENYINNFVEYYHDQLLLSYLCHSYSEQIAIENSNRIAKRSKNNFKTNLLKIQFYEEIKEGFDEDKSQWFSIREKSPEWMQSCFLRFGNSFFPVRYREPFSSVNAWWSCGENRFFKEIGLDDVWRPITDDEEKFLSQNESKDIEHMECSEKIEHEQDLVNHPSHYQSDKIEVIDIIEAFNLGFNLGNAIKYILRSDKKGNPSQDISKAIWYLNRQLCINEKNTM